VVHTEHEFFSYKDSAFSRKLIGPLSHLCDRMTVVGPEVADYFVRTIGLPKERVTIVPNGVDIGAFDGNSLSVRQQLGLSAEDLVIGTVGRLEPEKDHATLLEVFREALAGHPAARLLMVGGGSLESELRATAARLGIGDRTVFLGYRRDIPALLGAMDIFVLPSIREGLPISVIEAMAAGRPVVASNVGSLHTLVRDGQNGFLVPPQDRAGFVQAVRGLIASPELRRRVGAEGRRTVEASYSLSAAVAAYEQIYRMAAGNSHVWN
jgi:glycosyltransferase involved in cell wall biosynthesis